jgi:hypothetical protein
MTAFKNSRRFILSLFMLAGVVFASGCETNTNDPLPTGKTLTVGGKVNSASKDGNFITFSPSSEFYSARFYEGSIPFNDLKGSGWDGRSGFIDQLTNNTTMNDNINDHKSPFNVASVSALESGKTYTMLIFYTSATTDVNNQGTIVFTR